MVLSPDINLAWCSVWLLTSFSTYIWTQFSTVVVICCLWSIAGVDVSVEEIHSTVAAVLEVNMDAILEHRYHING